MRDVKELRIAEDDSSIAGFIKGIHKKVLGALGVPASMITPPVKRARGKRLKVNQKKTLVENGLSQAEVEFYLLQKTSFVQEGNDRRLQKSTNKVEVWTLINPVTGELKEVYIA